MARRKNKISCPCKNVFLAPRLKRRPTAVGQCYIYVPKSITKIDEIPSGAKVELGSPTPEKDILCEVDYKGKYFSVYWKDLARTS